MIVRFNTKRLFVVQNLYVCMLMVIPVIAISTPFAYADESGVTDWIHGIINYADEAFTGLITEANIEPDNQEIFEEGLDKGIDASHGIVTFWSLLHDALVWGIFSLTILMGFEVDIEIIQWVAVAVTIAILIGIFVAFIKKGIKVAVIAVAIVIALGFIGLNVDF